MAWMVSGFQPGETVDLREPGQTVFTDRELSDQAPVTDSVVADEIGQATLNPSGAYVIGHSATGRTSRRRVLRFG